MFRFSELFPILAASLFGLGVVACECPGSYTEVGGSCFLLLKDVRGDFLKARETCQIYNGDLAIIKDCALLGAVVKYVISQDIGSLGRLWIGGSDLATEGEWLWLDGSSVPMGAPFWARREANDFKPEPSGGTGENCAALSVEAGFYFKDINCGTLPNYAPLCQTFPIAGANDTCPSPYVSVGGSCLNFLSTLDMTWDDARVVCQINGGDLAIIDDCHLMSAVISYARQHGLVPVKGFWIGGSDAATEGVWTWIDGSAMAKGVPFWGRSGSGSLQPDNSGNEDCLVLVHSDQYYFNDWPCSNEESSAPLCQADPI